jgi:hypothetical protein
LTEPKSAHTLGNTTSSAKDRAAESGRENIWETTMRNLFASAILATTTLGFAVTASAQNWDMPTPYPDGNYLTQNVIQFAQEVNEADHHRP